MSTLKVNNLQVGQDGTAANNYTLYQPASPDGTVRLGYGVAGSVTDILTLKNSNLGIGTNNPTTESGFTKVLHVYDDSPQVLLERETGSGDVKAGFNAWSGNASLETFTATPLRIRTSGNTNQIYLSTNGSVGIDTNSPTANFKLDINGDLTLGESGGSDNTYIDQKQDGSLNIINSGRQSNGGGIRINKTNSISGDTTYHRDLEVYNGKNSILFMVDGSAGNIGIGTASPSEKLHISGGDGTTLKIDCPNAYSNSSSIVMSHGRAEIKTTFDASGGNPGGTLVFRTRNTAGSLIDSLSIDNTQGVTINSVNGTHALTAGDGGAINFRVDSQGRTLLTTTTASSNRGDAPLQVVTGANGNALNLRARASDNIYSYLNFQNNAGSQTAAHIYLQRDAGTNAGTLVFGTAVTNANTPSERLYIDNSGRVGINANPTTYANTDSGLGLLVKNGNTNSDHTFLDIQNDTSESGRIRFIDGDNGIGGQIYFAHNTARGGVGANCMGFFTANNVLRFQVTTTGAKVQGNTDGVLELDTTDQRGTFIRYQENGTAKVWAGCSEGIGTGGNEEDFGIRATRDIRLRPGSATKVIIKDTGHVGIGGQDPSTDLHVRNPDTYGKTTYATAGQGGSQTSPPGTFTWENQTPVAGYGRGYKAWVQSGDAYPNASTYFEMLVRNSGFYRVTVKRSHSSADAAVATMLIYGLAYNSSLKPVVYINGISGHAGTAQHGHGFGSSNAVATFYWTVQAYNINTYDCIIRIQTNSSNNQGIVALVEEI